MTAEVRSAYDTMAKQYATLFLRDLDRDANGRIWLARFATLAAAQSGPVADLGCGPGHVTEYLCQIGLTATGYDLSPGQIAEAKRAFPGVPFHVGDLAALDHDDSSLGGIVARYSIIHIAPARLASVFDEWRRVLEPGAPALISFFGSSSADSHGTPFDHAVAVAHELFPATIARQLEDTGWTDIEIDVCDPPEGGRPLDQATILTRRPRPDS